MIIDLKKYLFLGIKSDLGEFFLRAQEKGTIQFLSQKGQKTLESERIRSLTDAIKILRKLPVKTPYPGDGNLEFAQEIANRILNIKAEIEKLSEEQRFLEAEIFRISPFGDFSFEDLLFIEREGKRKIQFFCMKTSKRENLRGLDGIIYVGTDYDLDYFISINPRPKSYPGMIEMHFDKPVGELKNHLAFVSESMHQLQAELKGFAGHIFFLREALIEELDDHFLIKVKNDVSYPIEGTIFSIEGWVPENKIFLLKELVKDLAVHFERIQIEKQDKIPTCMENKGSGRLGEDLVRIYDVPSWRDKDPSSWVFWGFALFFAMIVSDGGYGLIYLSAALYLKFKLRTLSDSAKRFLKLFTILAISCLIWGVATLSFFGLAINPKGNLAKFSFLQSLAQKKAEYHFAKKDDVYEFWVRQYPELQEAKSGKEMLLTEVKTKPGKEEFQMLDEFKDNILLELSILVGLIHICLSLMRYFRKHWANIGWALFAIGGYLWFPITIHATSLLQFAFYVPKELARSIGMQLVYGGIILAVVLSFIQKRWRGLHEVTNLIQVSADILSYLRLYALALASTIMATTFNDLGREVGLAFGIILTILGHGVNIVLGSVAGVIHGLRLNFIEWYHYCFEGGGKLFNPLRHLKGEK
ncbi:MAG: V-type ATP synthase subunit I [Chlamydiae bacterium]|nr:V-type ATP synthase subunit I [Chlamydiota bacterium]